MVGLVMGVQAMFELHKMGWEYDLINIIKYLPVSSMYILSMTLGYVGLRYLEVSINSPVSNTSGAMQNTCIFSFRKDYESMAIRSSDYDYYRPYWHRYYREGFGRGRKN